MSMVLRNGLDVRLSGVEQTQPELTLGFAKPPRNPAWLRVAQWLGLAPV
jgi:hypothetical protein